MSGIWVRAGTVTLTNGSKKVTGSGTAWNSGTNKVTKGCAFIYNNIAYEVDYINSDTELYLVDTYGGTTGSGLSYRIQIAVTDTIPELASRIATALAYWNGQAGNLQSLVLGSGNVTLTAPDGTQVVVPSYSNMQPKDALLTALAALTTAADKLPYFTGVDTVAQTTLTAFARTLLDDIDAATARTTLGAQASDATLTALAAVVTAADKLIYATGADTFATATLTAFARTVLDDTDAATMLATLGVTKASTTETNARTATDRIVTPAGLNAVVPYTPTVNPSLDLDFSKQKYKYYAGANGLTETSDMTSLITFTRSTIATYFDAMGVMKQAAVNQPRIDYDPLTGECKGLLVEEQRTNLFPYSAYPASASAAQWWNRLQCDVYPNVAVAPDGTMTAAKAVVSVGAATTGNDGVGAFAMPSVTSSDTHTLTLYVKDAGAGYIRIRESINTGQIAKVNLTTGAITAEAGYTSTTFTVATTDVGNGWWRVVVVRTPTTTFGFTLKPGIDVGDGVSGIYVWGAQVEAGAFPTSYIPTPATFTGRASTKTYFDSNGVMQTAANDVAVTDYGYVDGRWVSKGLSLEPKATNLLTYSVDVSLWDRTYVSTSVSTMLAPDGISYATKITEYSNVDPTTHYISRTPSGVAYGTKYTASVFLKAAERTKACINMHLGDNNASGHFDLVSGVLITTSGSASARITSCGNGWYRCEVTATTGLSGSHNMAVFTLDAAGAQTFIGDGTSGIYVWGAQYETGPVATSYIPTTTAQVTRAADTSTSAQTTRAADNAVISGTNFSQWYKQYEGTLVGEEYLPDTNVSDSQGYGRGLAVIHDNTNSNRVMLATSVTNSTIIKNGVTQADIQVGSVAQGKHKAAIAFKNNSVQAAFDGATGTKDTVASMPYLSYLSLGQSAYGGGKLNGHIRSLKYFPKTITAAELQVMTA